MKLRPVYDSEGATEYATKYAYKSGNVLLSDTLRKYMKATGDVGLGVRQRASRRGPQPQPVTNGAADGSLEVSSGRARGVVDHRARGQRDAGRSSAVSAPGNADGVVTGQQVDSAACGERAPGASRVCQGCGQEFVPRRPGQECCAARCRARRSRARREHALRLVKVAIDQGDLDDARGRLDAVLNGR